MTTCPNCHGQIIRWATHLLQVFIAYIGVKFGRFAAGVPSKFGSHYRDKHETDLLGARILYRCQDGVSQPLRKSLSFSKKWENHLSSIKYFFMQYNLERQPSI